MQPDVLGTASLHDNALGEGSSLDVEFNDIMDVDFTLSISHLNDMLFGRRSRSSRVSVFDLDLVSLRSEMCSHGIDYSQLSGDSHAYHSALLSHVLLGDCFRSRCQGTVVARSGVAPVACKKLASGCSSVKSMFLDFLRHVCSYWNKIGHFTTTKLMGIVVSLGYTGVAFRPAMLGYLETICDRIDSERNCWDMVKELPSMHILPLAIAHGVRVPRDASLSIIKTLLQDHFSEGVCPINNSDNITQSPVSPHVVSVGNRDKWMDAYLISIDNVVKRMSCKNCRIFASTLNRT